MDWNRRGGRGGFNRGGRGGGRGFWRGPRGGSQFQGGHNRDFNRGAWRGGGHRNYDNNSKPQWERRPRREQPTKRLSEDAIGVTEYISGHKGFNGIIKSRYSDFQVSEINEQGVVAKLTDQKPPGPPAEKEVVEDEELLFSKYNLEILPMETWDQINKVATAGGGEGLDKVEIDATDIPKEQRTKIHDAVKKAFGTALVSSTVNIDDKKWLRFERYRKGVRVDNRVKWPYPGDYMYFIVHKENCDTMEAATRIAERLRLNIKPSMLGYAGTKDRRAKTSQWFSLRKVDPRKVAAACEHLRDIRVGNFEFKDDNLKLGMLKGNKFRIALRNVTADDEVVSQACEQLQEKGFLNYYGLQRFGSRIDVPTYDIGLKLLQGKFQEAIDGILEERDGPMQKALRAYKEQSAVAALRVFPTSMYHSALEFRLLKALAASPNDLLGALNKHLKGSVTVPRTKQHRNKEAKRRRGVAGVPHQHVPQRSGVQVAQGTSGQPQRPARGTQQAKNPALKIQYQISILEERDGPMQKALRAYKEQSAVAALRVFPTSMYHSALEFRLLKALAASPNDLLGALNKMARNTRLLYLHSYQSLTWNRAASERVRRLGLTPAVGDIVPLDVDTEEICKLEEEEDDEDEDAESRDDVQNGEQNKMADTTPVTPLETSIKQEKRQIPVKILTQEDVDSGKYTLFDIILPLPGHMIQYPPNMKDYYEELLTKDGLKLDMKHKFKSYTMTGAYRHLVIRPTDVSWSTVRYTEPFADLILSDWDELQGVKLSGIVEDGKYKALLLNMTLPASCYATMALRELLRVDTFQDMYGIPHTLGAVDGTHISIHKPPINHPTAPGSLFYNRKGYYSINCQMICDAKSRITSVNPNFPGSTHDAAIWQSSNVHQYLKDQYVDHRPMEWLLDKYCERDMMERDILGKGHFGKGTFWERDILGKRHSGKRTFWEREILELKGFPVGMGSLTVVNLVYYVPADVLETHDAYVPAEVAHHSEQLL
ncbi:tRNA pseudouridine synthase D (TruD) domain-containing protein [Phthorimaea operculella]|nr:tRNA pseudouridine synthase D (TruD) domain-containing protein [Phthorimaea operculella]